MELTSEGAVRTLSPTKVEERRRRLDDLGGVP
jgi:hypothetical protein